MSSHALPMIALTWALAANQPSRLLPGGIDTPATAVRPAFSRSASLR